MDSLGTTSQTPRAQTGGKGLLSGVGVRGLSGTPQGVFGQMISFEHTLEASTAAPAREAPPVHKAQPPSATPNKQPAPGPERQGPKAQQVPPDHQSERSASDSRENSAPEPDQQSPVAKATEKSDVEKTASIKAPDTELEKELQPQQIDTQIEAQLDFQTQLKTPMGTEVETDTTDETLETDVTTENTSLWFGQQSLTFEQAVSQAGSVEGTVAVVQTQTIPEEALTLAPEAKALEAGLSSDESQADIALTVEGDASDQAPLEQAVVMTQPGQDESAQRSLPQVSLESSVRAQPARQESVEEAQSLDDGDELFDGEEQRLEQEGELPRHLDRKAENERHREALFATDRSLDKVQTASPEGGARPTTAGLIDGSSLRGGEGARSAPASGAMAPAVSKIHTPFQQAQWMDMMQARVKWMVQSQHQSATIYIDPPELGPVHISIHHTADQTQISFQVNNAQVREALEQNAQRLRDALGQEGQMAVNVNVRDQSERRSGQNTSDQSSSFGRADNGSERDSQVREDSVLEPLVHQGLVNTYV